MFTAKRSLFDKKGAFTIQPLADMRIYVIVTTCSRRLPDFLGPSVASLGARNLAEKESHITASSWHVGGGQKVRKLPRALFRLIVGPFF